MAVSVVISVNTIVRQIHIMIIGVQYCGTQGQCTRLKVVPACS